MKTIELMESICKSRVLNMDLQFFSDEGNGGDADRIEENGTVTFESRAELDSWFDKKLGKSLKTAQEKWEADTAKRIKEAEQKGEMSAEEKAQFELKQEREQLEADRLALKKDKDEASMIKKLNTDKLPDSLSVVLTPLYGGDEKNLKEAYENISTAFRDAVEQAVNIRLAGSADNPAGGEGGQSTESSGTKYAQRANNNMKSDDGNFWK